MRFLSCLLHSALQERHVSLPILKELWLPPSQRDAPSAWAGRWSVRSSRGLLCIAPDNVDNVLIVAHKLKGQPCGVTD